MDTDREPCEQAGCNGFVSKPVDWDSLLEAVRDLGLLAAPSAADRG